MPFGMVIELGSFGSRNSVLGGVMIPDAGPLQIYNQLTTPINCRPPKLRARLLP